MTSRFPLVFIKTIKNLKESIYFKISLIESRIFFEFASFGLISIAFVKYSFACVNSLSAFAFYALYLSG